MHECTLAKKPKFPKPDGDIAEDEKVTEWLNTNCWLSLTYEKSVAAGNWKPLRGNQQDLLIFLFL